MTYNGLICNSAGTSVRVDGKHTTTSGNSFIIHDGAPSFNTETLQGSDYVRHASIKCSHVTIHTGLSRNYERPHWARGAQHAMGPHATAAVCRTTRRWSCPAMVRAPPQRSALLLATRLPPWSTTDLTLPFTLIAPPMLLLALTLLCDSELLPSSSSCPMGPLHHIHCSSTPDTGV